MMNNVLRRIACLAAMLTLGVASFPSAQAAPVAPQATPVGQATAASASIAAPASTQSGKGWGSLFGCAACAIGGALVVAGGPGSILIAVNTPGSAIALLACAGTCYEALAK